jgi:hypothetical protein
MVAVYPEIYRYIVAVEGDDILLDTHTSRDTMSSILSPSQRYIDI